MRNLPGRGEVWNADLDPTLGREQSGRRPVLVVSTDLFSQGPADLVVVLAITSKGKGISWHVPIDPSEGGLRVKSFVMCETVRCISRDRLQKKLGEVSREVLDQVEDRLRILLEL